MASPAGTLRVGPYFATLAALLVILYSIVAFGSRHSPKLGLDLVGGAQVTFTAKTPNGSTPSSSSMQQAKQIIADRVNGSGVSGADVVIQGTDQIVVSVPGGTKADIAKLGAAAVLNFRGLVAPAVLQQCGTGKGAAPGGTASSGASSAATTSPSGSGSPTAASSPTNPATPSATARTGAHSGAAAAMKPLGQAPAAGSAGRRAASSAPAGSKTAVRGSASRTSAASPTGSVATASATPASGSTPAASSAAAPARCSSTSVEDAAKSGGFSVPLNDTAYGKLSQSQQATLATALSQFDCSRASEEKDLPDSYFVACDGPNGGYVYLLGNVIVAGKQISSADAIAPNTQQPEWTVSLSLKGSGQSAWADYTSAHNIGGADVKTASGPQACGTTGTPCADYVCFTLDGNAISCPVNIEAINGGSTQIQGNFTSNSATTLANELKYGALPLSFRADQAQTVSATLGSSQLKAGLLAGGIGLLLVVLYSLIYYRALGFVTIASLLVSGVLTYGCLVLLGTQIGFTLSLAGIAGFIVAVGITADSFVVFFERLKDEVRDGRSVRVAVPRAWVRARRTILSADTVSFLAAAILYYFAAGDVRGFAFTLGLSTILDLAVVFLFTHPMVSLLSRSRAFGSARFTGLDALRGAPLPDEPLARPPRRAMSLRKPESSSGATATAVLERSDAAPDDAAPGDAAAAETASGEETPRRRTTPAAGTAAERAAARRARLREQGSGGSGQPGDVPRPDGGDR